MNLANFQNTSPMYKSQSYIYIIGIYIYIMAFPGGTDCKESACNAGHLGSAPESGGSPGEGNATHSSIPGEFHG